MNIVADNDAERAMLSSVWLGQDATLLMALDRRDFVDAFHQWLLAHLQALVSNGEPLDMVAFQRRVRAPGGLDGLAKDDATDWRASVVMLLTSSPTAANAAYYFRVLRTERLNRSAVLLADEIKKRILERRSPADVLAWADVQVQKLLSKVPDDDGGASDAAKAHAQPASTRQENTPAAARNLNGSAERDRAGLAT